MPGPHSKLTEAEVYTHWRRPRGSRAQPSSNNFPRRNSTAVPTAEMGVFAPSLSGSDGLQNSASLDLSNDGRSVSEPSMTELSSAEYAAQEYGGSGKVILEELRPVVVQLSATDDHEYRLSVNPRHLIRSLIGELEEKAEVWMRVLGKSKFRIFEDGTQKAIKELSTVEVAFSRVFKVEFI